MEFDLDVLRRTFVAEATDHLDELEEALVDLESRPEDHELLQRIFRVAHTFKGNAGSLGFQALADLGHALEDLIEDLERRGVQATGSLISLLLSAVDVARRMLPDVLTDASGMTSAHAEILERLKEARKPERGEVLAESRQGMPASVGSSSAADRGRTVRVDVWKLDRMIDLIGEIAVGRSRVTQKIREIGGLAALIASDEEIDRLCADLEDLIQRARMVPVGPLLRQYARTVRDVARAHGKVARLVVEGGDVEVDTAVIERIRDPLTHMIRNAIDHGIEPPDVRRENGKDPTGTITLRASHDAGDIVVAIADDGAGFSQARIAAQARARGLCDRPEDLAEEDLYKLVFEPGFSTAETVSDLSGRGVGMDVVLRSIDALRGMIRIESEEGRGSTIAIRLPLTLATIESFSVGVASEVYLLPLKSVVECLELPPSISQRSAEMMIEVRGELIPCVRLRDLFALWGPSPIRESVVVLEHDHRRAALVVDALHGEGRAVIKPLGRLFRGVMGIAGSTILGNGRVALILDVASLLVEVWRRVEQGASADRYAPGGMQGGGWRQPPRTREESRDA